MTPSSGVFREHQAQMRGEIRSARCRKPAAEPADAAGLAAAAPVWPVLVEQRPQRGDDFWQLNPAQVEHAVVVSMVRAADQVSETGVQRPVKLAEPRTGAHGFTSPSWPWFVVDAAVGCGPH